MKKTITVNLGGRAFQITEDAYAKLNDYLSSIAVCFSNHEGGEEITSDIESRISELCYERLQASGNVIIDQALVNEMIRRMGNPENMFAADDEVQEAPVQEGADEENAHGGNAGKEETAAKEEKPSQGSRFYRNADDKVIAGVISGIVSYAECKHNTRIDVTLLRILSLLLCLMIPYMALLYLLLWCVAPLADNTADRLRMEGVKPTPENIASKITDENYKDTNGDVKKSNESTNRNILLVFIALAVLLLLFRNLAIFRFNLYGSAGMLLGVFGIMLPILYITHSMLKVIKRLSPGKSLLMMFLLAIFVFILIFFSCMIVESIM